MQMHLALFSGSADPHAAPQNDDGAQAFGGGDLFAQVVAAGDATVAIEQSVDVAVATASLPSAPSKQAPLDIRQVVDLATLMNGDTQISGAAFVASTEAEGIEISASLSAPLEFKSITENVEAEDALPVLQLALGDAIVRPDDPKHFAHQSAISTDSETEILKGGLFEQPTQTVRFSSEDAAQSEIIAALPIASASSTPEIEPITAFSAKSAMKQELQPHSVSLAQTAQSNNQISGLTNSATAKLSADAPVALENPEMPAALAKAFASNSSPELANSMQAAALYQAGAKLTPQSAQVSKMMPDISVETGAETKSTPSTEIAPLKAFHTGQSTTEVEPQITESAGTSSPLIASVQQNGNSSKAADVMQSSDLGGIGNSEAVTAPNRNEAPTTPTYTATTSSQNALTVGPPLTAETSFLSDESFDPELQSLGFSAPLGEARAGTHTPVSQALLANPEVPQRVAQQMVEAARALPDRPVELSLNPEELGRVRMTMSATDGAMSVVLAVERSETLDLMRRHIDTLAAEFRALGYSDVSFSFSQQDQNNTGGDGQNDAQLARSALATDEPALAQNSPHKLALDGAGGMDIRL